MFWPHLKSAGPSNCIRPGAVNIRGTRRSGSANEASWLHDSGCCRCYSVRLSASWFHALDRPQIGPVSGLLQAFRAGQTEGIRWFFGRCSVVFFMDQFKFGRCSVALTFPFLLVSFPSITFRSHIKQITWKPAPTPERDGQIGSTNRQLSDNCTSGRLRLRGNLVRLSKRRIAQSFHKVTMNHSFVRYAQIRRLLESSNPVLGYGGIVLFADLISYRIASESSILLMWICASSSEVTSTGECLKSSGRQAIVTLTNLPHGRVR